MSEQVTQESWKQSIRTILTLQKKYQTSDTLQGKAIENVLKHLYELLVQLLDSQYFYFGADDLDILTCFFKYISPNDLKKTMNGSSVAEILIDHLGEKIKLSAGEFWSLIIYLKNKHDIFIVDLLFKKQKLIFNSFLASNYVVLQLPYSLSRFINRMNLNDIDISSFNDTSKELTQVLICLDIDPVKYRKFANKYLHANQGQKLQYNELLNTTNIYYNANLLTLVKNGILAFDSKMLKLTEKWQKDYLSSRYIITNADSVEKSDDLSDHLQQLIDCCLQNKPDTHLFFDDMKKLISFV